MWSSLRRNRTPIAVVGLLLAAATVFVASSLRRPEVPTFPPTQAAPIDVGDRLAGPTVYTIDASDASRWRFFDFSRGSVVEAPGPLEWDLAFSRFYIISNGGEGFAGTGGIADLGALPFDSVSELPREGYEPTTVRSDSTNAAIKDWYDYGWTSHLLQPKPKVFGVRTADGRYALIEILSYYCPGAQPGCITFRYRYQGAGGTTVTAPGIDG